MSADAMRGSRGESEPAVAHYARQGERDTAVEDLPVFVRHVRSSDSRRTCREHLQDHQGRLLARTVLWARVPIMKQVHPVDRANQCPLLESAQSKLHAHQRVQRTRCSSLCNLPEFVFVSEGISGIHLLHRLAAWSVLLVLQEHSEKRSTFRLRETTAMEARAVSRVCQDGFHPLRVRKLALLVRKTFTLQIMVRQLVFRARQILLLFSMGARRAWQQKGTLQPLMIQTCLLLALLELTRKSKKINPVSNAVRGTTRQRLQRHLLQPAKSVRELHTVRLERQPVPSVR